MSVDDDVLLVGGEREGLVARLAHQVRRRRLVLLVGAGLVLGLLALDQWQRAREMDALLQQVTSSEQAIDAASGSLQVVVDYYSPVVFRANAPAEVRNGLQSDLRRAAGQGAEATRTEAAAVASVGVLPWHASLRAARETYLARVDAWTAYLDSIDAEPYDLFGPANDVLPPTSTSRESLDRAVPWWPSDAKERIDELLSP